MGKKKTKQAGTPALLAVQSAGIEYTLHEYEHSEHQEGGYALDSARVLGRDPAVIFKTLMTEIDGTTACAVVPATGMLNLKSLAHAAHGKRAAMMDPAKAERLTGYVTGGISPLGQRCKATVFIDESALDHPTILISGGKRTLSLELAASDLASILGAAFAPIADTNRHA